MPEDAVPVAGHSDPAARSRQGNRICVPPGFNGITIAGKDQGLFSSVLSEEDSRVDRVAVGSTAVGGTSIGNSVSTGADVAVSAGGTVG